MFCDQPTATADDPACLLRPETAPPAPRNRQVDHRDPDDPLLDERPAHRNLRRATVRTTHNDPDEPARATSTGIPPLHQVTRDERAESELLHRKAS